MTKWYVISLINIAVNTYKRIIGNQIEYQNSKCNYTIDNYKLFLIKQDASYRILGLGMNTEDINYI